MSYKKYSKDDNISYTIGAFPTFELLTHKAEQVVEILLHEKCEKSSEIENLIHLAKERNIKVTTDSKTIEKISSKGNVFVVGVFNKYESTLTNGNCVCLVNPSDMGNLGTTLREMLGFDYKNLAIVKPSVDIFDPKVIRSSMGAIFSINIRLFESTQDFFEWNKNPSFPFMLQATKTLQENSYFPTPHTLIFGNEAHGLDASFLRLGTPLLIKHSKNIDSLNLPMSIGIALYEFSKHK